MQNRIPKALEYARLATLNKIIDCKGAKLGIVASGKTFVDVCQGLRMLGLENKVKLMKVGLLWPHDDSSFVDFAKGLDEIMIVEEKGPFLETAFVKALYGTSNAPRITGQTNGANVLLPAFGQITLDVIVSALIDHCKDHGIECDDALLDAMNQSTVPSEQSMSRVPYFCSGCPHNSSTPQEGLVGGGIGCHTMVLLAPKGKGEITGITQMGGEGAQWIGVSPFTTDNHFVQNLGDGTFHHSASLAVRASIAAKTNITYKLLFNSAVAMTGGQDIPGGMSLAKLTHSLWAEGVVKTIVCTENKDQYKSESLACNVELWGKDVQKATLELSQIPGTTVVIYDGECAAERRRKRKRGKAKPASKRVIINERVCEGCGDCGKKSSCLSVLPVSTAFGRKTEIAQDSCNTDFSCLAGDCPSFVTVKASEPMKKQIRKAPEVGEPVFSKDSLRVRIVGIGGTGIVTTSQVLAQAAILDGQQVRGLDQTGLAQKGGTVTSDIEINHHGSGKIPPAQADVFVVLDLVAGTSTQPLTAIGAKTKVVASSTVFATIEAVTDADVEMPTSASLIQDLESRCDSVEALPFHDYAKTLFGNSMLASMMMLGYAIQKSLIPVSPKAMIEAIELNQADKARNAEAFRWGRALAEGHTIKQPISNLPEPIDKIQDKAAQLGLSREVARLASELARWGRSKDAKAFLTEVADLRTRLTATQLNKEMQNKITESFALQLFSLWAYKDEYEIARLHLDVGQIAKREALFGKAKITYHLQPPMLRKLGVGKLAIGEWFTPVFKVLQKTKFLRGTHLDIFGYAAIRKTERALVQEYLGWVDQAITNANKRNGLQILQIIELPKQIRGYESVKMNNLAQTRQDARDALETLKSGKGRIILPMV